MQGTWINPPYRVYINIASNVRMTREEDLWSICEHPLNVHSHVAVDDSDSSTCQFDRAAPTQANRTVLESRPSKGRYHVGVMVPEDEPTGKAGKGLNDSRSDQITAVDQRLASSISQ